MGIIVPQADSGAAGRSRREYGASQDAVSYRIPAGNRPCWSDQMKKCCAIAVVILILIVIVAAAFLAKFNLSAMPEPGRFETRIANMGKHWMVGRAAAGIHAAIPAASTKSVIGGEMTFGDQCAMCHGNDGRSPTAIGKGLYPRALDLGSPEVQHWSDAELFWIVKNGIRLSGMPGFGKSLSDSDIGNLVNYVRSVKSASASPQHK